MNTKHIEVNQSTPTTGSPGPQRHGWMMIGCGVMLALVLILVATGAVGATLFLGAVACIAMMTVKMFMMSRTMGGHGQHGKG